MLGIKTDYHLDCSQVYTVAARAMIDHHVGPALLRLNYFPKCISGLPSWVLDWSAHSVDRKYILGLGRHGNGIEMRCTLPIGDMVQPAFEASRAITPYLGLDDGGSYTRLYQVRGIKANVVKQVLEKNSKRRYAREMEELSCWLGLEITAPGFGTAQNSGKPKSLQTGSLKVEVKPTTAISILLKGYKGHAGKFLY
jgi:hypothetical protein